MSTPNSELYLRRKWTFRAHQQSLVAIKKVLEKSSHVYMKAFLWALYLPDYPGLTVELAVGQRFKPDVVALAGDVPLFWGECGQVAVEKLARLFRRFPQTHFAVSKWARAARWEQHLEKLLLGLKRQAPVDFMVFPEDAAERWISEDGEIEASLEDVLVRRFS